MIGVLLGLSLSWVLRYGVWTQQVYAYLDLGTGSYFFQLMMAGLFGAIFMVKGSWKYTRAWFSRFIRKQPHQRRRD